MPIKSHLRNASTSIKSFFFERTVTYLLVSRSNTFFIVSPTCINHQNLLDKNRKLQNPEV